MRILYIILKITLNYSLRIFYPRMAKVNAPRVFFGRTIYVSNHAASFMDPISIASINNPIVFFMTRSDVFTKFTKPFLWACQMLPIYRQHDGEDTKKKNEEVFKKTANILKHGRNLLIFGEGFTDDVFIRRLKPVKKGAARIGFQALEDINWKKKIYICAMGVNYSDPSLMRSDYLIAYQDKICLNDFRQLFEENPNKAINDVTKLIEKGMQDSITHVEDKSLAPFHENIMTITRKGMHPRSFDKKLSLVQRWEYSRKLANWLNGQKVEDNNKLSELKTSLEGYQSDLKKKNIEDHLLFWKMNSTSKTTEIFALIFLLPFVPLGLLHCFIPYIFVKRFAENNFKRKVFWSSVKVVMGMILMGLINIPFIFLFYHFVYPSYWLALLYYFGIGLLGLATYQWFANLKSLKEKSRIMKMNTSALEQKRTELEKEILNTIEVV